MVGVPLLLVLLLRLVSLLSNEIDNNIIESLQQPVRYLFDNFVYCSSVVEVLLSDKDVFIRMRPVLNCYSRYYVSGL